MAETGLHGLQLLECMGYDDDCFARLDLNASSCSEGYDDDDEKSYWGSAGVKTAGFLRGFNFLTNKLFCFNFQDFLIFLFFSRQYL